MQRAQRTQQAQQAQQAQRANEDHEESPGIATTWGLLRSARLGLGDFSFCGVPDVGSTAVRKVVGSQKVSVGSAGTKLKP